MPRLKATSGEIERHLAQLADTVPALLNMTSGLGADELSWSPGPKEWSVVEILAHLRACADVWSYSIYAMLTENQPVFPLIDERRWAKTLGYATLSFEVSISTFTSQRADLLRTLAKLDGQQWERTCQIEGRNHSVFSQMRRMALHEVEHWQQFQEVVNKLKAER